jgi:condensin complex subunit 2
MEMDKIKAAASPMRKISNNVRANSSSPRTPQNQATRGKENRNDDDLLPVYGGGAMTPMKRVPILANFEEWMKMATDNKINATNSWNFALIDYFHDMSLLKEGDGVNFQKASCTLDGCVKIYTSRVDSVATETGKLLSGLADSGNKKQKRGEEGEGEGEEGEEDEEEEEDGVKKRVKKKTQRSSEATLAPSFASLHLKKFELEFSVDPLFKKASADFDEGGAKGLLLNHLAIDSEGRIVFDSSDDIEGVSPEDKEPTQGEAENNASTDDPTKDKTILSENPVTVSQDDEIDLDSLRSIFFPNLDRLDEQDICPSLKNLDLGDPSGTLDIPFLKAAEELEKDDEDPQRNIGDHSGIMLGDDNSAGFDDDDGLLGGFDMPADIGFGEGGEVWANGASLDQHVRVGDQDGQIENDEIDEGAVDPNDYNVNSSKFGVALQFGNQELDHENMLNYFDNKLKKDWAGPEHWRIRKIKDNSKPAPTRKRKEKEPFEIDFLAPLTPEQHALLYTQASSNAAISLPKNQRVSKTRNLLPDDKHFSSRDLLRLFLKPQARIGSKKLGFSTKTQISKTKEPGPGEEVDEAYWARDDPLGAETQDEPRPQGDYDANFFQDDGLAFPNGGADGDDDDQFADAREAFSPDAEVPPGQQGLNGILAGVESAKEGGFGSQLVTQSKRIRPEYVQYARVAKKVDVRRLKEEMWKGIGFKEVRDILRIPF